MIPEIGKLKPSSCKKTIDFNLEFLGCTNVFSYQIVKVTHRLLSVYTFSIFNLIEGQVFLPIINFKNYNKMKTIKTAVAALLIAGGTIAAFAFTKAEKSANLANKSFLHNYFVTGSTTIDGIAYYTVTEDDPGCPNSGAKPCEVISSQPEVSGRIKQSDVTQVLSLRP